MPHLRDARLAPLLMPGDAHRDSGAAALEAGAPPFAVHHGVLAKIPLVGTLLTRERAGPFRGGPLGDPLGGGPAETRKGPISLINPKKVALPSGNSLSPAPMKGQGPGVTQMASDPPRDGLVRSVVGPLMILGNPRRMASSS